MLNSLDTLTGFSEHQMRTQKPRPVFLQLQYLYRESYKENKEKKGWVIVREMLHEHEMSMLEMHYKTQDNSHY